MNIWSPELSTYLSFPQVPITMSHNPLDDPDFDDDLDDDDTEVWFTSAPDTTPIIPIGPAIPAPKEPEKPVDPRHLVNL